MGHVATMMSGKSIAAAIALFTMPIISRLFTPSDFGVAAAFLSIIGIVSNVGCLSYETAIVLPKEDAEAISIMALAYRILFAICGGMLLTLGLYEIVGLQWSLLELLGTWMWILPLGVLLEGALALQAQWLGRQTAFKLDAASTVVGTVVNSGTRISFGTFSGSSPFGLIFGNLLGMSSRLILQKSASREGAKAITKRFAPGTFARIAREYRDFPILNAPANLIFSLGQNLPVLFFGTMFSPAIAGLYAMANRLTQAPVVIVTRSVRRVFLQKAAAIRNRGGNLRKAYFLTCGTLLLLGLIPCGLLWFFGQPLLQWLLGDRWLEAGRYLEIMAPWLLMLWVNSPSNPVFVVLRKQNVWLVLQTTLTIMRLGAFGLAYVLGFNPERTLQAFVVATVLSNLITMYVASVLISRHAAGGTPSDPTEPEGSGIYEQ